MDVGFDKKKSSVTDILYDTTPPNLPGNFTVNNISYRGEFMWFLERIKLVIIWYSYSPNFKIERFYN